MSDAPLKNRETEGSVAVVAVVAVILKPITATAAAPSAATARDGVRCDIDGAQRPVIKFALEKMDYLPLASFLK